MSKLLKLFLVFALVFTVVSTVSAAEVYKYGSRGTMVTEIQTKLGVTPVTGYFGPITKAAVMAFQTANPPLKADGIVGPMTLEKLMATTPTTTPVAGCGAGAMYNSMTGALCTTTTLPAGCTAGALYSSTTGAKCDATTTPVTPVVGLGTGEGDMSNFDEVSSADSKLQEGAKSELFAFTADVEGDVKVDRVDFYLDSTAAASQSDNADDYFKSAILKVDGKEVATLNVSDFTEDTYGSVDVVTGDTKEYRLRFSGLNLVFKDGDSPKFVLALEANSSIDGTDITETWGVELLTDSVRFVDGKGFTENTGAALEESFTVETEDVAKIAIKSSSADPDLTTFEVSDTDTTKDVTVFKFKVEEENDVDLTIDDMTITLTTTGTTDESAVVTSADLYKGSTLLGSESVPSNGVVAFTDLGLDIAAGDSAELTLKLTFTDLLVEGTTVTAVVTNIDSATDENGNDESDMTITGEGLSSEAHILRSTGISVNVKTATTTINTQDGATNDLAEFTWVFDVVAFGDSDIYINSKAANILSADGGEANTVYGVESSAASSLTALSATMTETDSDVTEVTADTEWTDISDGDDTFFKIEAGTTGTFTLTVTGTNETASKQVRGLLSNIEWTSKDVTVGVAEALAPIDYTSNLGVDAATPFKSIN